MIKFGRVTSRAMTISGVQFHECTIDAGSGLKDVPWYRATLDNCTVVGRLTGCDFGHWTRIAGPAGSVRKCNFGDAQLEACRFFQTDLAELELPVWPSFSIERPHQQIASWGEVEWPGDIGIWMRAVALSPPEVSVLVHHAPTLARKFGADEDALRGKLSRLSGVLI